MKGYKVIAVFWEDHTTKVGAEIPKNPDEVFDVPTLTVGILLRETDKSLLVAHDIERLENVDNSIYTVILKSTIISTKVFGRINLNSIRWKGA
jgi:hypothetical protein